MRHSMASEQTGAGKHRELDGPRFYLTGRAPLRPGVILLAALVAAAGLILILFALSHGTRRRAEGSDTGGSARAGAASDDQPDDKDDPNQIDTIVLGDPSDAPMPAKKGNHVSSVHPTILIVLPRSGEKEGMIPDGEAGRLLYAWLAAFNQGDRLGLEGALPSASGKDVIAGQMELRQETGGFNLVSAKDLGAGVLVFRLRDQTPAGNEALGTLVVREDSIPARIGSLSVRMVPAVQKESPAVGTQNAPTPSDR